MDETQIVVVVVVEEMAATAATVLVTGHRGVAVEVAVEEEHHAEVPVTATVVPVTTVMPEQVRVTFIAPQVTAGEDKDVGEM